MSNNFPRHRLFTGDDRSCFWNRYRPIRRANTVGRSDFSLCDIAENRKASRSVGHCGSHSGDDYSGERTERLRGTYFQRGQALRSHFCLAPGAADSPRRILHRRVSWIRQVRASGAEATPANNRLDIPIANKSNFRIAPRMLRGLRDVVKTSTRAVSLSSRSGKKFEINDNTDFVDKVMNSRVPVIVNFHAEWCDPCKILTPKLEELIGPMEDLNLAIVNVEQNPELVHTFEVKAVPAVIAVSNGLVVDKFIGLVEATMIENLIKKLTASRSPDSVDKKTQDL